MAQFYLVWLHISLFNIPVKTATTQQLLSLKKERIKNEIFFLFLYKLLMFCLLL
jgi:hypothetical protein